MAHHFKKTMFRMSFDAVVDQLTWELYKEGFVILYTADIRRIFREELHADLQKYEIMSVMIPHLSNELLKMEPFTGMLQPCTITIRDYNPEEVEVTAANPSEWIVQTIDNPGLQNVAEEISRRLNLVIETLSRRPAGIPDRVI